MNGARRSAHPVRIALAAALGRDIDGAWWPYTASLANELPELIEALHRPLGEVIDISVIWCSTEGSDPNPIASGAMSVLGWRDRRRRLMVIAGRDASAKLLVVPHMTRPALGWMVLRRAAAIRVSDAQRESQVFA